MPETIFRVTVQETSKNILNYNGIDAALNININDYKECYVMVERLLGSSDVVDDLSSITLELRLEGITNQIGVSTAIEGPRQPSHIGIYRGIPHTIPSIVNNVVVQTPMMFYDYECYTQNWLKVSLSTIGNIVLTTNFVLTNNHTSSLYAILKFKFVK
jgi:hypothetical protein